MLRDILLHLARNKDFPEGSAAHGYDIVAPVDSAGRIDGDAWKHVRGQCRVRRFWQGEDDQIGLLVHHASGLHGAAWQIDFVSSGLNYGETAFRLETHHLVPGEYVSVRQTNGQSHTFKVAHVHPLRKTGASAGSQNRASEGGHPIHLQECPTPILRRPAAADIRLSIGK